MAKFVAGNDPADHTVAEVVEYLKGDDATPDEYERVMEAERGRDGGGRVGIISMSGAEPVAADDSAPDQLETPSGEPAAGPNEAATGQPSPADEAKTSADPYASGDAGTTSEKYGDDDPASLGPDMPQSQAEADAHAATLLSLGGAQQSSLVKPATQTPEEALKLAGELSERWKTRPAADSDQ